MNYMAAIGLGFPAVKCHALGMGDVYETLVWDSGESIPSQEVLDIWIAANPDGGSSRKITNLAFRNRFTAYEKTVIEIAALDIPAADMGTRMNAAYLRGALKDMEAATYIDLARDDTRSGVMAMEAQGIIGAGRALIILDSPIQANEIPLNL